MLYLNMAAVRSAIHAAPVTSKAGMFISCTRRLNYQKTIQDVVPEHQSNLAAGAHSAHIYICGMLRLFSRLCI